jgi:hypothetical protein
MQQTIEVIVHPDGRIEASEPLTGTAPRRALLTILDEAPSQADTSEGDEDGVDAILRAGGLLDVPQEIDASLEPLSEDALDQLWLRIPTGTPLSQIIAEEREEAF